MWQRRAANALSLTCALSALLTIWWPRLIPAQDAPLYHFAIVAIRNPARFAGFVDWGVPVSGGALQLVAAALGFLSPTTALKLLLSLSLLSLLAAAALLSLRAQRPPALSLSLAAAGFVGFCYAMGFFNFLCGACLALLACALWLEWPLPGRRVAVVLGLLSVASYLHAVAVMFVAIPLLAASALCLGVAAAARRALLLVPSAGLCAAALALGRAGNEALGGEQVRLVWLPLEVAFGYLPQLVLSVYSPLSAITGAVVLLLSLLAAVRAASRLRAGDRFERTTSALALAGGLVLIGYLVAPLHAFDFFFVQPRLLLLVPLLVAPALLAAPALRHAELPLLGLVACALLSGIDGARREGARLAEAAERLPHSPVGLAYVVVSRERARHFSLPLQSAALHVHAYGTLGGGASAFTFPANPYLNPLRRAREDLLPSGPQFSRLERGCERNPACFEPAVYAQRVAARAVRFDTVLLPLAPASLLAELDGLGWRRLSANAFSVGKAEVILIAPDGLVDRPLEVRAAPPRVLESVRPRRIRLGASGRARLGPLPAGPLAIEVFRTAPGRRSLLPSGRLTLVLKPGQQAIVELEDPSRAASNPSNPD